MNIWERLNRLVEAGPFEPSAPKISSGEKALIAKSPMSSTTSKNKKKVVQLADNEIDAILDVIEKSSTKNVKGVDLNALGDRIYLAKVKKESMGSGNSTSSGDAEQDIDAPGVERSSI